MPLRDWQPALPAGTLRTIVLHWTAGDYDTVFPAYHFCISGAREIVIAATHDLTANMRDVRAAGDDDYAAHTRGRNSFAAGIAICAMRDATPADFGAFALTDAQIDAMCRVSARLVRHYGMRVTDVRTHAEAACEDGYFGAADSGVRWDIARLRPSPASLVPAEAAAVGDELRARIAGFC